MTGIGLGELDALVVFERRVDPAERSARIPREPCDAVISYRLVLAALPRIGAFFGTRAFGD